MEQSECVSFDDDDVDVAEETLDDDVEMADAEFPENGRFWAGESDSMAGNAHGIDDGCGDGGRGCEKTCNNGGGGVGGPRRKRKKKKRRKSSSNTNISDVNRFVINTCKRLKEKKSYLLWNAIGCLGVSAMMDLVKEVDTIERCGGQKTADGKRFRTGGGVLWNILKNREPKAYKEIMAKGKEFEKQFRRPQNKQLLSQTLNLPHIASECPKSNSSENLTLILPHIASECPKSNSSENLLSSQQNEETSESRKRRSSVHDRIRVPVVYDDLLEEGEIYEP